MTFWMLRRLLKFCLKKYIGPYIQGELDLEQLDFQLSAAVHLNDISLNVDAINAKISEYPFALKEGSLERVTLKLSPQLNIEVDGVELHFVPQIPTDGDQSSEASSESACDAQQTESHADRKRSVGMEGFTYMPVQEGVRVVADLFERLFFGVHIILSRVFIAIEETPKLNFAENGSSTSHCMLLCRIGCAQYRASRLTGVGGDRQGEESSNLMGDISFQQVSLELVDVRPNGSEDLDSMAGNSEFYGQPISLMQDDAGLTGHVKLSICTKPGSLDTPKVDAEVNLEHMRLHFTAQQIEQVLRVLCSYRARAMSNVATARGVDPNDQISSSCNELFFTRKTADTRDCREASLLKRDMLDSQISSSKCSLLPGAKVISDWVHRNDQEKDIKETVMSEEELAASTEEFFDCLSGSGLWMLTSSALSAVSGASSFLSGSVLHSPGALESSRQATYAIKMKLSGLSVLLIEGHSMDHYIEAIVTDINLSLQVCKRHLTWQLLLRHIEAFEVRHQKQDLNILYELDKDVLLEAVSTSAHSLQDLVEQCVPKFPVSLYERSQTGGDSEVVRKCFLRLSDQGHLPALQVNAEHKLSPILGDERNFKKQDLTAVHFHSQPLILWVDAPILCMLLNWAKSFGSASEGKRASLSEKGFSVLSTRQIHINMFFSHIRMWVCSPYSSALTRLMKDHLLCLDLSCPVDKLTRPMVKLKLSDSGGDQLCLGLATLAFTESYLYLVSSSVHTEGFEKGSALGFHATKLFSISLCNPEMATVEIYLRSNSGGGISLAERAWLGVAEQQKGGMGGRKSSSEFAAATATEVTDTNNHKIREDILRFSSACVFVTVPKAKVELLPFQHSFVVEVLTTLAEASTASLTVSSQSPVDEKDNNQVSLSFEVGEVEVSLYPDSEITGSKRNSPWEKYLVSISKLQMLHVVKLGMVKDASYFWLHHENGFVKGLLPDLSGDEILLLSCRDDALGRGDGGGGNALATKFAGIEVSVISWPGVHAEDSLITVALGGCTFMAHGGRLDWLLGLITFFSRHADETLISYAIHQKACLLPTETSIVRLETCPMGGEGGGEISSTNNSVLFSLDLHDAALCYEPGKEAVSAAIIRAKNSSEQFDPVACLLAAAAIRVSSNAISNSAGKTYEIWLRDVALLLADTSLRRSSALDYTQESLHQAGYVKVAGEAVMKAVVHIDGEDGLEWEVQCANNQLRLDTCHDTTAALGRLIAQLQQLFIPEEEHPIGKRSTERDVGTCYSEESSGHGSSNGATEKGLSDLSFVNSRNAARFEGFLEDACLLVRGCSVHSCCNCLDLEATVEDTFEMLSKSAQLSDDVAQESLRNSSDQWFGDGGEREDLRTPVLQNDEASSFIEDYYVSKVSSLQSSSQSSSYRENGASLQNSQALSDDLDIQNAVDGSGGWYDGHSFKVVDNHVPELDSRPGYKKHRDNLHSPPKMRLGRLPRYPQSVGRVIFQDLNLRWRLYGGSDWPASKRKDPEASSARQNGVCLEVIFHGVDLQHDTFPRTGVYASRLALSIQDVGIYDCSKGAAWKKVLGYYQCKSRPRESSAKTLKAELESVRPDPLVPVEEYRLSVQLLPLLLHLDQRHIDFLTNFFTAPPSSSKQLSLFYEEISSSYSSFDSKVAEAREDALLPFFQICELQPFSIKVDYIPRHLDIGALRSGNYAELANLFSWKGIELELKLVRVTGVHGWGTLSSIVVGEWLEDISQNQIHKLLKGLGPIRPIYAVGSGAAKLVVLPAEQYKRDRRHVLRGIRKGAAAFLRSVSLEAVGLGVQLAAGAHEILLQTESALGSVGLIEVRAKVGQPGDMREGLQQAYESLSLGLERTATSLIGNSLKAYHKAGTSTAVASALRAAPAAAVAPAVAAAGALHRALLGMRNGLDPERRRESEEKHSDPPPE